jgi:hypothetical protein
MLFVAKQAGKESCMKQAYEKPALIEYGNLSQLTGGIAISGA